MKTLDNELNLEEVKEKKMFLKKKRIPFPKIGDEIYIPTELYLSHGVDDFDGGLCKISEIEYFSYGVFVEVEERPEHGYNYEVLFEKQAELKKRYGKRRGKPSPDYRFESNCWATPGDIVDGKKIDYYII